MPSGASAEGKRRYRARLQERVMEESGEYVNLNDIGTRLAADRAAYNAVQHRTFLDALALGYVHVSDFEAKIQQMQRTHVTVMTMIVPASYVSAVIAAQDAMGSLFIRVFAPPPPEYMNPEEDPIDVDEVYDVNPEQEGETDGD